MVLNITPMTVEQFDEWVMLPENIGMDYEYIGGEIKSVVAHGYSSRVTAIVIYELMAYMRRTGIQGKVTGADGGYQVAGERYIPDVAYSQDPTSTKGYNPIPPDLAVEVISDPSSAKERAELHIKTGNYLADGCVVWIINPETQSVEVYTPNKPVQVIPATGTLTGGDLLPDFSVLVKDLFPQDG
ncbi:MAG: Uma2 family endonuclease [bacterium]|nr:Uma2 family endonuclease [bacterium]